MITIELTSEEEKGFNLAGDAPDEEIHAQIDLILSTGGMTAATAAYFANRLTEAALRARAKIREATAYEIKVVD